MSLTPVADGELAAVVTYLEMAAPPVRGAVPPSPLRLERRVQPSPEAYRALFRRVGARWLWFSRLVMADAALQMILESPLVELFAVVDAQGADAGMVELDFRERGACELAFLGLVPEQTGRGLGPWLLAETLDRAWRPGIERVHVHTCSLDHPAALGVYRRAGFVPTRRAVEGFADPRLAGILPIDCAPQVPLLGTPAMSTRCA